MELTVVPIVKPDAANFIFGQSHFIRPSGSATLRGQAFVESLMSGRTA